MSRRISGGFVLLAAALAGCGDVTELEPRVNPLAGVELFVSHPSSASLQADAWRETRPGDAAAMDRIAREPQGVWLTGEGAAATVESTLREAHAAGEVPVFVAYNIPYRDCTAAGAASAAEYRAWIAGVAAALTAPAIVVLEPDALAAAECVPEPGARLDLLAHAAATLTAAGALVYIDAGHPRWLSTSTVVDRLRRAGVERTEGFSLNVANFVGTAENVEYGQVIAVELGGAGFIIDTSRNGAGPAPDNEWCNPPGRKLGPAPTTDPPYTLVDALLWVKRPGESDGLCNGGPPAGEWWPEYALGLAR